MNKAAPPQLERPYEDYAHTGPGTLAGRFLRSIWQPIHRSAELAPSQAKPIEIMSERYTLYRGESGTVHLVGFQCAHRCSQLSTGWVEGEEIRCLYHGWKYDGLGRCTEQPAEQNAFADEINIGGFPVREHLGLIFAFLGEGVPPHFPHIPAFRGEGIIETWVEPFPCNMFQAWENSLDFYHTQYTHLETGKKGVFPRLSALPVMEFEETDYGLRRRMRIRAEGPLLIDYFFMPNVLLQSNVSAPNELYGYCPPYRDSYLIKIPVDDENHLFFATQLVGVTGDQVERYTEAHQKYLQTRSNWPDTSELAQEILAGKRTLAQISNHPYLAIIEDIVAQGGQGKIADRSRERLGKSDLGIARMRRIWSREMKNLAEGLPAKKWQPMHSWPETAKL